VKILLNDVLQKSDAPKQLLSPALYDRYAYYTPIEIGLNNPEFINSIGIGFTDATSFKIEIKHTKESEELTELVAIVFEQNGLYMLPKDLNNVTKIKITCDGTYIGRIAAGRAIKLGTSIAKEPSYMSTNEPRETLSGQVIEGAGGYFFRQVSLDTRYKIGLTEITEIEKAYQGQISKGYPFFLLFEEEALRLPFLRLYANDINQQNLSFESSVNRFLFSKRFTFKERF